MKINLSLPYQNFFSLEAECGIQSVSNKKIGEEVGLGKRKTSRGEYPWVATIHRKNKFGESANDLPNCHGALINNW